ncbi:MAG: hypothetical protein ABEK04_02010, partial [Candidatus Nanohalobium sp.]
TGYTGFVGIDVLEEDGELYAIDPNIRITAATPGFMLGDELEEEYGRFITIQGMEVEADSFQEVTEKMER